MELEAYSGQKGDSGKFRKGERSYPPFRSDRFFSVQSLWYFRMRGGETRGPFIDQKTAGYQLMKELHLVDEVAHNWDTHRL